MCVCVCVCVYLMYCFIIYIAISDPPFSFIDGFTADGLRKMFEVNVVSYFLSANVIMHKSSNGTVIKKRFHCTRNVPHIQIIVIIRGFTHIDSNVFFS